MKKYSKLIAIILIAGVVITTITSCKKEAGLDVTFKMRTTTTTPVTKAVNSLEWTSGSVTICEIVFDGDMTDGESVSITHEQISTIDLITGNATPEILVTIPMGEYKSVNLGIEIFDENDTPSVITEGTYTNADGVVTPIRFEFNSGEVFEANAASHTFKKGDSPVAEIDFSPAFWFSTITAAQLDNATRVEGVIIVSESYNSGIFDIVADKLDDATQAYFK
ncbi:MAG: hypothetical protein L3J35_03855 [Bacteroidales bacterium]|nr:hypothetical protein [Bacteroidales bacterium]